MNTNQLKRFATEARNKLKAGIAAKITTLGFDAKGNVSDRMKPELIQNGSIWNGNIQTEAFYYQLMSLYERVQQKGINEVYEEAAYTWFNRLVAIRILQKNGLTSPVMEYAGSARTPKIVDDARQRNFPQIPEQMRSRLVELLEDDTKVTEQFALLISTWCHQNPIINACFGGIADYTELLLPNNILAEGQFIDLLNHTEFITDADYRSPELIGWLYQFYISERKDEVFAKKGKFEADEIPAATQIFTPNWIVKYMVQNTVGRIYLDNNPYSDIKKGMQYLVEPAEQTPADAIYHFDDIHDLTCADLACGSGHILNECFDLLYQIYIEEGYNRKKAIEDIFKYNLTGVDIDTRAKQLATFALLLNACQKDNSFTDAHSMPKVYNMPEPYKDKEHMASNLSEFLIGSNKETIEELSEAIELMDDAQNLGSIMKFNISERTRNIVAVRIDEYEKEYFLSENINGLMPYMTIILSLTQHYSALVMHPPYMGRRNMNNILSKYVKENYDEGKADLATVFVQHMAKMTYKHGKYGFIIPPSWMFLSTFEKLRKDIIDNRSIDSLLHLSRGVFGAYFGASSVVISNTKSENSKGTYFRLIESTFQEFDQKNLQQLFEKTFANHDFKYYLKEYSKDVLELPYTDKGNKIYYPNVSQKNFEKIPGSPIGYWVSKKIINIFKPCNLISSKSIARSGFSTGDNDKYVRLWSEVNNNKIGFGLTSNADFVRFGYKYVPFTKGGGFRRWYGNFESIVDWTKPETMHRPRSTYMNLYYKPEITWNAICSGKISCRFYDKGFLFEHAAVSLFVNEGYSFMQFLAYLNTPVFQSILSILNPTLNTGAEVVSSIPILSSKEIIEPLVRQNIAISKRDWDSHET